MKKTKTTGASQSVLVQKVSKVFLGARDFKKLAKDSVDLMTQELKRDGILGAAIFRTNEKDNTLAAYAYSAKAFNEIENILPVKFSTMTVSLDDNTNLLVRTLTTKKLQEGDDFFDFSRPVLNRISSTAVQKAAGFSLFIAYPLRLKSGHVAGVLLVALKNEEATENQRIILETYRLQLELAFENVLEFERLLEKYRRDTAKANERTHQEDIPTVRFTLRITPKQDDLLESEARKKGVDKTTLIRSLIDGLSVKTKA